jgi:hypothetical protein
MRATDGASGVFQVLYMSPVKPPLAPTALPDASYAAATAATALSKVCRSEDPFFPLLGE